MSTAPRYATPDPLFPSPDADHADLVARIISPPLSKRYSGGVRRSVDKYYNPRQHNIKADFGDDRPSIVSLNETLMGSEDMISPRPTYEKRISFTGNNAPPRQHVYHHHSTTPPRRYDGSSDDEYGVEESEDFDYRDFDNATDATPDLMSAGAGSVVSDERGERRQGRASSFGSGSYAGGSEAGSRSGRSGRHRHGDRVKSWNTDVQRGARESSLDQGHDIKDLVADLVALNHDLARANIRYGNLSSRAIELRHQLRRSIERLESMDQTFTTLLEDLRVLRFEQQFLTETLGLLQSRRRIPMQRGAVHPPPPLLSEPDTHDEYREEILTTISKFRSQLLDGEEGLPTTTTTPPTHSTPTTTASATTALLSGPHGASPPDHLLRRARLSMLLHDSSLSLRDLLSQIGHLSPRVDAAQDALDACSGFSAEYRRWISDAEGEKERLGGGNSRLRNERRVKVGRYGERSSSSSFGERWGLGSDSGEEEDDDEVNPELLGGRGRRERSGGKASREEGYFDAVGGGEEDEEEVYYSCPETFDVDEGYLAVTPVGSFQSSSQSYFTAICTPPASDRRSISSSSSVGSQGGGAVGVTKQKSVSPGGSPRELRRRQTWSEPMGLPASTQLDSLPYCPPPRMSNDTPTNEVSLTFPHLSRVLTPSSEGTSTPTILPASSYQPTYPRPPTRSTKASTAPSSAGSSPAVQRARQVPQFSRSSSSTSLKIAAMGLGRPRVGRSVTVPVSLADFGRDEERERSRVD